MFALPPRIVVFAPVYPDHGDVLRAGRGSDDGQPAPTWFDARRLDGPRKGRVRTILLRLCTLHNNLSREVPGRKKDDRVHIDLATDIVKALFDDNLSRT